MEGQVFRAGAIAGRVGAGGYARGGMAVCELDHLSLDALDALTLDGLDGLLLHTAAHFVDVGKVHPLTATAGQVR